MNQLALGTVIADRYRIAEYVTEGGMGQLYKVRDLRLEGMMRAMKVLKPVALESANIASVRQSEAKLLTLLQHQGLPIIYDHIYANEYLDEIIVMEWIEGQQLDQFCAEQELSLSIELILSISIQLIEAIQYLHEQKPAIIHRDIKPTNIMICRNGQIKLIDFGISKLHQAHSTLHTIAFGTPEFAAPEQLKGLSTDERSDIYSFGCILYFLCTKGKRIGSQYDRQQVEYMIKRELAHIPIAFRQIMLHCLQPDPKYRIVHASQIKLQLVELINLLAPHTSHHATYTVNESQYRSEKIKSIGVFSLNTQAGATTIAMLLAQHYALHSRVKFVEYCGHTACLESIPALQKLLPKSTVEIDGEDPYYKVVAVNYIEHHIFRTAIDTERNKATDSFTKTIHADSSADYQVIDFSSGWSAETIEYILSAMDYVLLVCDPTIIVSNERSFRNIERLLMALEQYHIAYTWINNKDTHFSGRKSWNALNNGREVYSVPLLSPQDMYSEMWSRHWLSSRNRALKKLHKKLMPLIDSVNSALHDVD